jgi:signal transduction histidine kinase
VRNALGPFGAALDMLLELALALTAAWLTGGLGSPLLILPGLGLVLSRRSQGAAASRFLACGTVVGLVVLALASGGVGDRPAIGLARLLWPLAWLAAMEVALPERGAAPAAAGPRPDVSRAAGPPPAMAADPAAPPPSAAPARAPSAGSIIVPAATTASALASVSRAPRGPGEPREPDERDARTEILHDLRSPVSVIKVYADLIAERARRGEPPVDEHLRNLSSEIELMEQLVEGPAATRSRRFAAPDAPVDLVRILGELASRYRETQGEALRIEMSAERPRVEVRADPVALQRVFRNVLDNAIQYTPAGGTVRIRLWADGAHAHVVVSDTGVGMSPAERERVFEVSYRGRGAQALRAGGRGLGLTLSRELVEAMGGSISLWSEEHRGSEVRVLLPVAAGGTP